MVRGRLAPSPTGFLHLGNAWALWAAWLAARSAGGEVVLRLEDVDPDRSREEYAEALVRDLAWLGLDWDYGPGANTPGGEGPDVRKPGGGESLFKQSCRGSAYAEAVRFLEARGLVYPCYCTRKELRSIAGAPHGDDVGAPYPGTCRFISAAERARHERDGRRPSLRLFCPPDAVWEFTDRILGPQRMTLTRCGGDFALRRSDGVYAYQLAVVVDDMAAGITQVVRGNDILASTPRQMYLYSLFGEKPPEYAHLPLVTDEHGERLAKRHAGLTLKTLREAGVLPETILGWLAVTSGLTETLRPLRAAQAVAGFRLEHIRAATLRLPPDPVAYFLAMQKKNP